MTRIVAEKQSLFLFFFKCRGGNLEALKGVTGRNTLTKLQQLFEVD